MAKNTRPPARPFRTSSRNDGDGNHIQNEILLDLPRNECDALLAKLEFVRLKTHHVLHEPGDTFEICVFLQ